MKLHEQIFVFAAVAIVWCSASGSADVVTGGPVRAGCKSGALSIEELVIKGLASPDYLIIRRPKGEEAQKEVDKLVEGYRTKYFKSYREKYNREPPDKDKPQTIDGKFTPVPIDQHDPSTLEEKAQRIGEALRTFNKLREESPAWENYDVGADPIIYTLGAPPQDEYYSKQCGLKAINAETAWNTITDAKDVTIAIVDTGMVYRHDDLPRNAHPANPDRPDNIDTNGHGTHVAGIIGASKDDVTGIVGVTWKTKEIIAYRFTDSFGRGDLLTAMAKIDVAIKTYSPQIVLLAWGTGANDRALYEQLKGYPDVLFVAAAGNEAQDTCQNPVFPASYKLDNLISVMATTCDDVRAQFSNYGEKTVVDLAAPGEGLNANLRIFSTVLNNRWGNLAGTSMSAAFAAGAAALVIEQRGTSYTPAQIKCWLKYTADPLTLSKPDGTPLAMGRLNVGKAVEPFGRSLCFGLLGENHGK